MGAARKQEIEIHGQKVGLSNLDKVLYPSGFTKGQVIDYYLKIADYLLPHIKDRPMTMKRYPNGVQAPHFYEKDAPKYTPSWVKTFPVLRRSGEASINYVLINDLPTLAWSANLANLEMHPFLARVPHIERPTAVVFDLDPGEGTDVLNCAEVAFQLKAILDGIGLQSFAKVSGSKGLQLYVPLNTPVTYAATQPFARGLADRIASEHPKQVVAEMAKALRKGKVFIDWSQNSDFKTTVAVYSLRGKSDQPFVSMPVEWEELRRAVAKRDKTGLVFTPEDALERVRARGDLFAPVLKLKQKLPGKTARAKVDLPPAELKFAEPMAAKMVAKLPEGREWLYEIFLRIREFLT